MTLDHLPWLANFVKYFPIAPDLVKMRQVARARTAVRFERGAESKDLFYYLVGIESFWYPIPILTRAVFIFDRAMKMAPLVKLPPLIAFSRTVCSPPQQVQILLPAY